MLNRREEFHPVDLGEDEILSKGAQQARKELQFDAMEQEHKDRAREMKEQRDALRLEIRNLAQEVSTGKERRLVAVYDEPMLRSRVMATVRADTGEVVAQRPMTPSEVTEAQQASLPGLI